MLARLFAVLAGAAAQPLAVPIVYALELARLHTPTCDWDALPTLAAAPEPAAQPARELAA